MQINISAVSYTNTKPFIYGLHHAGIPLDINLSLDVPSECAQKLIDRRADVGIVPVAAIPFIPDARIITDFCIGAEGPVNSVFIFSQKPIHTINSLRLDKQSRTSNNLAKVLLHNFWNREVALVLDGQADAFVEIGDRTFGKTGLYPYVYDLASCWIDFTGLPFAFATWTANRDLPPDFMGAFNKALAYGIAHRAELLRTLPTIAGFDLEKYLMVNLDYHLTDKKRQAIELFLHFITELESASKL
ncbi:chorismate dehydratase [bacterium A37T11]|nr:chorismate dehydratase [bacterium A37T11]